MKFKLVLQRSSRIGQIVSLHDVKDGEIFNFSTGDTKSRYQRVGDDICGFDEINMEGRWVIHYGYWPISTDNENTVKVIG